MNKISLIENSYSFLNEAILNHRRSKRDLRYSSFGILHLIQSLELMMKHVLRNEHPILIYENVDNPVNTVSLKQCLQRLKGIANVNIDNKEEKAIKRAIAQRNKIVHYEYEINQFHQHSVFVELFEFIHYFHEKHVGCELHDFINEKLWRTEAELLAEFNNERVTYKGRDLPNTLPLEIVIAQKYRAIRVLKDSQYYYYPRTKYGDNGDFFGGECPDCGVDEGEYHVGYCDIEKCPACGHQLLMCLISDKRCCAEYWIPRKADKLEENV